MNLREKPFEELQAQMIEAESAYEEKYNEKLRPRDWNGINKYDLQEAQSKYRVRYEQYVDLLRKKRQGVSEPEIKEEARILISGLNNLDNFIRDHKVGKQEVLRGERQLNVFEDLQIFLEKGETEGYVKLPTGVGKTVLFTKLIEALGLRTLIVVPRKTLVTQTGEKIEEFASGLEFGHVYSGKKKDYSKPVTITTYQSLVPGVENETLDPELFPLVILDEAHNALSELRVGALSKFKGIKIGFTATPTYAKDKDLKDLLETEIHSLELYEAIEEGLLCETQTIHAHTNVDLSEVTITSEGEYKQKELEKAINILSRNKAALDLYKKVFSKNKTVCYCTGVNQAQDLNILFKEEGISSAVITGETKEKERDEILGKFKTGEIMVLLNVQVLIEGFDEKSCNTVFNLHPTLSMINAEQRGGRALRLDDNNPNKVGYVVDFIDKNAKKPPVLFSEILGGSSRVPEKSSKGDRQASPYHFFSNEIFIEGLTVDSDPESILRVSNKNAESRNNKKHNKEEKETLEKILTFEKILSKFSLQGYELEEKKDNLRFFINQWVEKYIKDNPNGVTQVTVNDHTYDSYSEDVLRYVTKKFEAELARYPKGVTLKDFRAWMKESKIPAEISKDIIDGIRVRDKYERLIVRRGVFGNVIEIFIPIRVLECLDYLMEKIPQFQPYHDLCVTYLENTMKQKMAKLGLIDEKDFLSEMSLRVKKEDNFLIIKKKYFYLKNKNLNDFFIRKKNGKEFVFVPYSISSNINKLTEDISKREEKEVMEGTPN